MTEKEKKAIEMYKKGVEVKGITQETNVNIYCLYKLLRETGMPFRQDGGDRYAKEE